MNVLLTKQFSGIIRKMKTSEDGRLICLEEIVSSQSCPLYHVIDVESCRLVAENIAVKNNQHLVLKEVTPKYLIVNEYDQGKNPDSANVIVYDFKTDKIAWEKDNLKILEISDSLIKVPHQYFVGKYSYLDIRTGEPKEVEEQKSNDSRNNERFPIFYSEENEYFNWFAKFILDNMQELAVQSCEYLELNFGMIISYYTPSNQSLKNNLMLIDNEGNIEELINIGENLQGIGKDTFFVLENKLIFVSHKNTLNIYEI